MPKSALVGSLIALLVGCGDGIEVGEGRPQDGGAEDAAEAAIDDLQLQLIEASQMMKGEWKPPPGILLPFTSSPAPTLMFKPTMGKAGGTFEATCSNRNSCPLPSPLEDAGSSMAPKGEGDYKDGGYLLFDYVEDDGEYRGFFWVEGWSMGMTFKPAKGPREPDLLRLNPFAGIYVTFSRR